MSKFKKYQIKTVSTRKYVFYELEGKPWVEAAPAQETNSEYYNKYLRAAGKSRNRRRGSNVAAIITLSDLQHMRESDYSLYSKYIVKSWGNVVDTKKQEVPLTVEDCEDFLRAIPTESFDALRNWAVAPSSFDEDNDDLDEEELAKN